MKKVLILLSGCGVYDGSEIYETTFTLLSLEEAGVVPVCCAPDIEQAHVIDHSKGEPVAETRRVLVEAARLARGEVLDLATVREEDYAALILPGGFGAAKNLCDFAFKGKDLTVHPLVEALIEAFHAARKPIGFMCIAPVIGAKVLGSHGVRLTIGNDAETAGAIEHMGARHENCSVESIIVDAEHRIVSTPAYMLGENRVEVRRGIDKLVKKVLELS